VSEVGYPSVTLSRVISLNISVETDCEEGYLTELLLVLVYNCLYRDNCFNIIVYIVLYIPCTDCSEFAV